MKLLQSLLYGFLSGFSDALPISAQAHQVLLLKMFGAAQRDALLDFFTRMGILMAILFTCAPLISKLNRERRLQMSTSSRRNRTYNSAYFELRLLRTAIIPMIIVMLFRISVYQWELQLIPMCLLLILNGIMLIIPEHMRHGNKDAQAMTAFDGILLGIGNGISVLPGISRVGAVVSYSMSRGVSGQNGLNWAFLLSIPALILLGALDLIAVFSYGVAVFSFTVLLGWIISAIGAFAGTYFAVMIMRFLSVRTGYSGFAYYSWGMALLTFILFLLT